MQGGRRPVYILARATRHHGCIGLAHRHRGHRRRRQPRRHHWSPCTQRAIELLDRGGLAHRAAAPPSHMPGGEQQHVAVARALANDPQPSWSPTGPPPTSTPPAAEAWPGCCASSPRRTTVRPSSEPRRRPPRDRRPHPLAGGRAVPPRRRSRHRPRLSHAGRTLRDPRELARRPVVVLLRRVPPRVPHLARAVRPSLASN